MDPNGDREVLAVARVDGGAELTEIPPQFLLPKPKKMARDGLVHGRPSALHEAMQNERYNKKLAREAASRELLRYRVPVNRPLPPTSGEAGGEKYEAAAKVESIFAPLFRDGSAGRGESVKLDFLTPAAHNPRLEVEQKKLKEQEALIAFSAHPATSKKEKKPNLDMKVPKGFVPQCATVQTASSASRNEGRAEVGRPSGSRQASQMRSPG
ncbi:hypothetical protein DQ04_15081010 [Trypanosoma grayi]|uniref:hypothetical protein n=1 Tax=Trypanosoma grayi TaxID=71804 RepID=UPI0004F46D89|nr:hypothetical protein DQ04_15081010 [Trypanosoma grayi]KEG06240.1 hypothetical protein DQ04_15081010 [Trypanosoma grayi]